METVHAARILCTWAVRGTLYLPRPVTCTVVSSDDHVRSAPGAAGAPQLTARVVHVDGFDDALAFDGPRAGWGWRGLGYYPDTRPDSPRRWWDCIDVS